MSRQPDELDIFGRLTEVEQDIVADMMRMTGEVSQSNIVRLGLWHLARHLEIPVGHDVFAPRTPRGGARTIRTKRLAERVLTDAEIVEPAPVMRQRALL